MFHHQVYHLLKDWYGHQRAGTEMTNYCPNSDTLGDLLDDIMAKALPPEEIKLLKIKSEWATLAGSELTRFCTPVGIRNGIITVEVSHPAWLRELRGPVKQMLIDNINRAAGELLCRDLFFVPGGHHA